MQLILVKIKWKYLIKKFHDICLSYYFKKQIMEAECVGSFNMDWQILVFYPEPEARDTIY
jgi:hypothetical protein